MTPASRARSTRSRWLKAVRMTTGAMRAATICSAAESPSSTGILTSSRTRSGRSSVASRDGRAAVAGLADDGVALLLEHLDEVHADERLVLGDQHPHRRADGARRRVASRRRRYRDAPRPAVGPLAVGRAPGGIRTHTVGCLRPVPLPVGLRGRAPRSGARASVPARLRHDGSQPGVCTVPIAQTCPPCRTACTAPAEGPLSPTSTEELLPCVSLRRALVLLLTVPAVSPVDRGPRRPPPATTTRGACRAARPPTPSASPRASA